MSNLTFRDICRLFCCPPCPGHIAAKLAFIPPDPTYTIIPDETGNKYVLHLTEHAEWQYSDRDQQNLEVCLKFIFSYNNFVFSLT